MCLFEDDSDDLFEEVLIEDILKEDYLECTCGAYIMTDDGVVQIADCIC